MAGVEHAMKVICNQDKKDTVITTTVRTLQVTLEKKLESQMLLVIGDGVQNGAVEDKQQPRN